ncbi:MAG: hypothetical protein V1874_06420 [Spirochaetota bacterium]
MNRFRRSIVVYSALIAAAFLFSYKVSGKSRDIRNIPNGKKFSCAICHADGKGLDDNLTQFGKDYEANGRIWDVTLAKKCSNGSGVTNGQMLGDPDGKWKKGDGSPELK